MYEYRTSAEERREDAEKNGICIAKPIVRQRDRSVSLLLLTIGGDTRHG